MAVRDDFLYILPEKALKCLYSHGHIHRDVKARNILVGASGAVKLADLGVSACLFDVGDRQRFSLYVLKYTWHPLFNLVHGNCRLDYSCDANKPLFR